MITYANVQDKINLNLADNSNIIPLEHREVEQILLDYITENIPLYKGSLAIGDVSTTDQIYNVTFPTVGTDQYYVIGSIRSNGTNFNFDNDVFWIWKDPTATGFKLGIREVSPDTQNITFYYEIKKI